MKAKRQTAKQKAYRAMGHLIELGIPFIVCTYTNSFSIETYDPEERYMGFNWEFKDDPLEEN